MQLANEFSIPIGIDESWAVLTDVRRIAPCLPGAYLTEVQGNTFNGGVRVKVGPITASYRGAAHFVEMDRENHRALLRADAREERGSGNARADIEMKLQPGSGCTVVAVETQLAISGRLAQFGRGVIADIGSRLIDQFAAELKAEILSPHGTASSRMTNGTAEGSASPLVGAREQGCDRSASYANLAALPWPDEEPPRHQVPTPESPRYEVDEAMPLDLMSTVIRPYLRKSGAPIAAAVLVAAVSYLVGRRHA